MRLFIPDPTDFFTWLESERTAYAVLRGFADFDKAYPKPGSQQDIDLLVEDKALPAIAARYKNIPHRRGVKFDIYTAGGTKGGDHLGHPYFPKNLARMVLSERRMFHGKFYAPSARAHLLSLIYHLTYRKAERSGIDAADPAKSAGSKYVRVLEGLKSELGLTLPLTLQAFHQHLQQAGITLPYDALAAYLRDDFTDDFKSAFMARLCHDMLAGEFNLFVIRKIAVKKGWRQKFLDALADQYEILTVKDIPWFTRLTRSKKMRGGKWRRGGRPRVAVAVFDPKPFPAPPEQKKGQPFVYNARQFIKREWREWFTRESGAKASANPVHSSDNEAEAIGQLPLFFTEEEQQEIFAKLAERRADQSSPQRKRKRA